MTRINVYDYAKDEYDETVLAGWFNVDSAASYTEATRRDGSNHVSVNPVGQYGHQHLYRTTKGRWVLNTWSQWQGVDERYEFVDDDTAKDWLIRNDEDEAVQRWFGALEEGSGPNLGGRPTVGPKKDVRLPAELWARVDEFAAGRTRAEAMRELVEAGLNVKTDLPF